MSTADAHTHPYVHQIKKYALNLIEYIQNFSCHLITSTTKSIYHNDKFSFYRFGQFSPFFRTVCSLFRSIVVCLLCVWCALFSFIFIFFFCFFFIHCNIVHVYNCSFRYRKCCSFIARFFLSDFFLFFSCSFYL